ncbi:MAG TPA: hypothetical protein DCL44_01490 [Elusimicrobia bacterium]|nr:hypothetical protein [Elusimicrobiota bacterium]
MTEMLNHILKSLGYGLMAIALCYLARLIYKLNPSRGKLDWQLLSSKNKSAAVGAGGYFLAVIISLGGPISWVSASFSEGALEVIGFGTLALALLNASMWIADKTYLKCLHLDKKINKGSLGAGLLRAAHEVALAFVILGASWGDSGGIWVMVYFWGLGQLLLAAAIKLYFTLAKLNLAVQLEKDNTAAVLSAAGITVGLGFIAWAALSGPFLGWLRSTAESAVYYAVGTLGMLVFRAAADLALLPGATFRVEVLKKQGNIAIGILDASLTIGIAILMTWCLI